jgi:protein ImuB
VIVVWLALYVPALSLQAFPLALIKSTPVVIIEKDARRSHIVARNQKAARLGIELGQSLAEANALSDAIVSLPRDPLREAALLQRLAEASSCLTPNVHINDEFGVLLDVTASVNLFGGLKSVQQRAQTFSDCLRLRMHAVVAPTASGARWLARGHQQLIVDCEIERWLDNLMLDCTDIAPHTIAALKALNLGHLGAVRRIPSRALGKRFGEELPLLLARAYGEVNEGLVYWQPQIRFHEIFEFLDLTKEQAHWMPGVEALLERLQTFLQSRASSTQTIHFSFILGSLQRTEFPLQAAHEIHLAADWLRLFTARLSRVPITHEVSSIELSCERVEAKRDVESDFFDNRKQHDREWAALTTLIKFRLGESALQPIRDNSSALPESSIHEQCERAVPATHASDLRPVLLYDPPKLLTHREVAAFTQSIPMCYPERIQERWLPQSDRDSTLRDYYIARTSDQRLLWVFRKRPENDWFIQGLFA